MLRCLSSPCSRLHARPAVALRTQRPRAVSVRAGRVEKLTSEQLEVAIAERDRPLIVDFYATWCGPCVMLASTLEALAEELGDAARFVKARVVALSRHRASLTALDAG
jgi:thiol-disulfide isomerase/thioredoxin